MIFFNDFQKNKHSPDILKFYPVCEMIISRSSLADNYENYRPTIEEIKIEVPDKIEEVKRIDLFRNWLSH